MPQSRALRPASALPASLFRLIGARLPALAGLLALSPCPMPAADTLPAALPITASSSPVLAPDWRAELTQKWSTAPTFGGIESSAPEPGLKLVTRVQPEHLYSLEAVLLTQVPVHQGDTLMIRFAARSIKADAATGVTKIKVGFSKASPPWNSSYVGEIGLGSAWQRFDIPFTCRDDFAAKAARLSFAFGYPAQIAEIADVQVLNFGPGVALDTLPRTRRFADPVSPELLARETERIASLRTRLEANPDPSPAHGRTLHVAPGGSARGVGSSDRPFATIPQALAVVKPGDTIEVAAGEYREVAGVTINVSGRPDAWIKLKAAPGARPKIISSGWHGFGLRGGIAYIEIDGFELEWAPNPAVKKQLDGVGIAPAYASHHLRFLRNVIHGFGTGGICSLDCDYVYLEGNTIYNTAKTSPYGGSAISLCRAFNFDDDPGYHNVVRGNICHDNELLVSVLETSGGNGRTLTDGNGIIIDVFKRSRANPLKPHTEDRNGPLLPYRGRTLIENNLIYDNGGRGIHVFRSEKVDVVNNTCYLNQKSADINAGEFTAIEAGEVTFFNNIAYGRAEKRGNSQDGSTRVIWSHNLFYHVDDVLVHDGLVEEDPLFAAAGPTAPAQGFRVKSTSPALGHGLPKPAPTLDLAGDARPKTAGVTLGAYQLPASP